LIKIDLVFILVFTPLHCFLLLQGPTSSEILISRRFNMVAACFETRFPRKSSGISDNFGEKINTKVFVVDLRILMFTTHIYFGLYKSESLRKTWYWNRFIIFLQRLY